MRRFALFIFSLFAALALSACSQNNVLPDEPSGQTPTFTTTPLPSPTSSPSFTPTPLPSPTLTPTFTPTPTPLPELVISTEMVGAESYLLSVSAAVNRISIYEMDYFNNMSYNKEQPVISFAELKAGEQVAFNLFVPEGIPSSLLSIEDTFGTVTNYIIAYDGRDGGICLVPIE